MALRLRKAQSRQHAGQSFATVVHAHFLEVSIGTCIHDLALIAQASTEAERLNQVIYLPL